MLEKARSILKVKPEADNEEIRKAYLKLARRYPPEHFPDKFAKIKQAYEQLLLDQEFLKSQCQQVIQISSSEELYQFLFSEEEENKDYLETPQDWFDPEQTAQHFFSFLQSETRKQQIAKTLEDIDPQEISLKY